MNLVTITDPRTETAPGKTRHRVSDVVTETQGSRRVIGQLRSDNGDWRITVTDPVGGDPYRLPLVHDLESDPGAFAPGYFLGLDHGAGQMSALF